VYKVFKPTEKVQVQFRAEACNVFNHTQWNGVNNFLGAPNFLYPTGRTQASSSAACNSNYVLTLRSGTSVDPGANLGSLLDRHQGQRATYGNTNLASLQPEARSK
jgi:hypothetical protein